MEERQNQRGEELFDALNASKKKRKRKVLRTVLIVIALIVAALVTTVMVLRKRVEERFAAAAAEVQSYTVATGTINTIVSGSGTLTEVDLEERVLPAGVEVSEVLVEAGDLVEKGDLLAKVDMATVMTALSDLQEQLDDLDDDIASAKGDTVSSYISAGVSGRVKRIFAEVGMDVSSCMAEFGALAHISLDGYMAVDLETDALEKGVAVSVVRSDGTSLAGKVDAAAGGFATVLVTDNGPQYDEEVTVLAEDGSEVGSGKLYIHNPLAVTGYAGTINSIAVKENSSVSAWSTLFNLKNTSFSANYDTLLRERSELEEELMDLLTIYRDGAVLAPYDAMVSSVEYDESVGTTEGYETALLTLYPNVSMAITIGIDETDILALEEGQEAEVEVGSVSDEVFTGIVTEISKVADTSSGVTQYSAEVTLEKAEGMLPGMTASVDVKIEGVENALIIPVDALHQTSAISYVYTSYDEELKQYGGMVEVTTGMQNDNYVEILSGLKEGDVVYYTEQEDIFSFFMGMGGMGGFGGSSGGGMPSGMPNMGGSGSGRPSGMPSGMGGGMPGGMPGGMNRGG